MRFSTWLSRVLERGESVLPAQPVLAADDREGVGRVLVAAHRRCALSVAGSPLPFVEPVATGAAEVVARACWRLVSGEDDPGSRLRMPAPTSAADHLSADVLFRFLPTVYRRAMARSDDALVADLGAILRLWPLAGVLAQPDGEPAGDLNFFGHPGLQLLYAERLTPACGPDWVPPAGPAREWAERVFADRGRPLPARLTPPEEPRA